MEDWVELGLVERTNVSPHQDVLIPPVLQVMEATTVLCKTLEVISVELVQEESNRAVEWVWA